MNRISAEQLVGEELAEWYALTPMERWEESAKLWEVFLSFGGSLDPEPDTQSPSSMQEHRVRALLMGGQACVLYCAAEFSRDVDFAIVAGSKHVFLSRHSRCSSGTQRGILRTWPQ